MNIEKKYYEVNSFETLKLLVEHIKEHEIIAYDTETNSLNTRKNKIIGFSICGEEGLSFYFPVLKWNFEEQKLEELYIEGQGCLTLAKKVLKLLVGKKLICHNGAFDIPTTNQNFGINLIDSLYCETILLIHTVQEEGVGRGGVEVFGLKKVAIAIQDKIGLDVEKAANEEQIELKASIEANGGSVTKENYEIYKADPHILAKYGAADTDLTLRIFHYYSKILENEGLEKFFYIDEVMPVYKEVTIPMQEAGVNLDIPLLEKTKAEITADMERYKKEVISALVKDKPGKQWVLDKATETFPCKKTGPWGRMFIELHRLNLPKTAKGYSTAVGAIKALELAPEDEWQREFLLTNNPELVPQKERLQISLELWKQSNDGDLFNVQSATQLAEIVFKYYGEKPIKTNEETGKESFDGWVIQELSKKYDWVEKLRVYRKLQKIYTTYIERFLENQEDGKYYPYWKQHGTISGRFASNLQQLPKPMEDEQDVEIVVHYNRLVRQFLIAGPGYKLVDADFESLEPHTFSFISGDEGIRDIFRNGWDFYSTIAIMAEKLDQDKKRFPNGVSADKKSPIYLKKLDPVARNRAKSYSLGTAYGQTPYALAQLLKIKTKEAQAIQDNYFGGFPELKKWYDSSREKMYRDGYIANYVGRIRHLKRGKEIYDTFGLDILNSKFRQELIDKLCQSGMNRAEAEKEVTGVYRDFRNAQNNCLNFQNQSLGADIVNRAALAITRKAKELKIDAVCIAQIHDQLVFRCREDQAEEFRPIMENLMETTTILPGVPLKAPACVGRNMYETH